MIERTRRLGRALCFAGAIFGALGVLAWLLGRERILTVVPGLPPMMPNSALALFLLGVAGVLVVQARSARWQRSLVTFAAVIVLAISLGTVAEYTLVRQERCLA